MLLMMRAVSLRQEHDGASPENAARTLLRIPGGRFRVRSNCCTLGVGLGDYR
jgi:hypothetical protein